ncbi:MAG: hypothetical protein WCK48_02785 [bacterium]
MLKSLEKLLSHILDSILPKRSDFEIVRKLTAEHIAKLPPAPPVAGNSWITPLFHYKDNRVRAIIWELKYKNNTLPLEHIGKMLYEEIVSVISDTLLFDRDAKFVLLPIPISAERRSERGYNQSEYIARAILENDLGHVLLYAPQWFEKVKETPKQSRSESREQRMKNLDGCFRASDKLGGMYAILVDDVVTTGTTLCEARKTLFETDVRNVFAFTIAH